MIQFNLVARINDDKNSFLDLVYAAHKLKLSGFEDFNILFIGSVYNAGIYRNIVRMAELLGVTDQISLTKKSIPIASLPVNIKEGYFINLSVGGFIGYSGIESMKLGFKNIFYNCDKKLIKGPRKYINVCPDLDAVIELFKLIMKDSAGIDRQILLNDAEMTATYALDEPGNATLLSLMLPQN
jgi:hypothetical protein